MITSLFSAMFHRPSTQALTFFRSPRLPASSHVGEVKLNISHVEKYNALVGWQHSARLHPLYLQVMSLPLQIKCLTQAGSPVPVLGLVHTSNFVKWHERALTSTHFKLHVKFDTCSPHPRGWEVSLAIAARDSQGEIYRAVPKYLMRISAPHVARRGRLRPDSAVRFDHSMDVLDRVVINADLGRRYALVSGDFNPIHLWPFSARMMGFKHPIAHGMWSLARSYSLVNDATEMHYSHPVHQWRAQFYRPLPLPGQMNVVMTGKDETSSTDSLHYAVYDSQCDGLHLSSTLTGSQASEESLSTY